MSDDRFHLVGRTLKDEFRVERFVAEGGFGTVYQATQTTVGRDVAIKVLKTPEGLTPEARAEYLDRFGAEARTLGKLAHPAIVQVLDFGIDPLGEEGDTAWMALEWIPGSTLEDELKARRKQGGRPPAEAYALLRDVLRAVAHAHDLGTAHRDLKPANIMVVRGKRETTVRLLDFGIAKLMSPDEQAGSGATRTKSAQSACSPRYAAPEQLSGARTGPWTDVHALGLILTEVLTDRAVYPGKTLNALMVEALSRVRPTPAKFGVDVGPWEPILARAVALRPDDRYPNAGDLLDALEAALPEATRPSLARATPAWPPAAPGASAPAVAFPAVTAPAVLHAATAPAPPFPSAGDPQAVLPAAPAPEGPEGLGSTQAVAQAGLGPHDASPATTADTLHAMPVFPGSPPVAPGPPPPAPQGLGFAPTLAATPSPLADLLRPSGPQPQPAYQHPPSFSRHPSYPRHPSQSGQPVYQAPPDQGAPAAYRAPVTALVAHAAAPRPNPALIVVGIAVLVAALGVGLFLLLGVVPPPASATRQAVSGTPVAPAPLPSAPGLPPAPVLPPAPGLPPAPQEAPEAPRGVDPGPPGEVPMAVPDEAAPGRRGRRGRRSRRSRRDRAEREEREMVIE